MDLPVWPSDEWGNLDLLALPRPSAAGGENTLTFSKSK